MEGHRNCPFCGSKDVYVRLHFFVECRNCGANGPAMHGEDDEVWSAWDRREGEESTPIYIMEFRAKGGKWHIFDMDGDRSRKRAESYIPSNQTAYPDCEFRVVKYQRVEGK